MTPFSYAILITSNTAVIANVPELTASHVDEVFMGNLLSAKFVVRSPYLSFF